MPCAGLARPGPACLAALAEAGLACPALAGAGQTHLTWLAALARAGLPGAGLGCPAVTCLGLTCAASSGLAWPGLPWPVLAAKF